MNSAVPILLFVVALAALALWFLRPRARRPRPALPASGGDLANALPRHYRFFPMVRQALSAADHHYLREHASERVAKQVLRERRKVARQFLRGLHEDFSSLERLARMVASLSPQLSREQETERLLLSMQFRLLYALVQLRLSVGMVPLHQMEHLTELIGRFALRMEQAMAAIAALSADRVPRELSA